MAKSEFLYRNFCDWFIFLVFHLYAEVASAYLDEEITTPLRWFLYLYAVIFIYNNLPSEKTGHIFF